MGHGVSFLAGGSQDVSKRSTTPSPVRTYSLSKVTQSIEEKEKGSSLIPPTQENKTEEFRGGGGSKLCLLEKPE